MKPASILAVALAAALTGCTQAEDIRQPRAFSQEADAAVRPGMTPDQVLDRIGTPTRVAASPVVVWYYTSLSPQQSPSSGADLEVRRRLTAISFTSRRRADHLAIYVSRNGQIVEASTHMRADDAAAKTWRALYGER